jgi:hypothetical protein
MVRQLLDRRCTRITVDLAADDPPMAEAGYHHRAELVADGRCYRLMQDT